MPKQEKNIFILLCFTITLFFHGCSLFMKPIAVESLHNIRGYYDKENKELSFTFVFVDSWLTIIDYDFVSKKDDDGRNVYYLTLVGKYQDKGQDVVVSENLRKEQGTYHLTLKDTAFNPLKDKIDYKDGRKLKEIPVLLKLRRPGVDGG